MLTTQRIDHVVLTCRDVAATIRFYTEVLGMREVTFGAGRKALAFGRQKINLHPTGQAAQGADRQRGRRRCPTHTGSADLCLIVAESVDRRDRPPRGVWRTGGGRSGHAHRGARSDRIGLHPRSRRQPDRARALRRRLSTRLGLLLQSAVEGSRVGLERRLAPVAPPAGPRLAGSRRSAVAGWRGRAAAARLAASSHTAMRCAAHSRLQPMPTTVSAELSLLPAALIAFAIGVLLLQCAADGAGGRAVARRRARACGDRRHRAQVRRWIRDNAHWRRRTARPRRGQSGLRLRRVACGNAARRCAAAGTGRARTSRSSASSTICRNAPIAEHALRVCRRARRDRCGAIVPRRLSLAWYAQSRKGGVDASVPAIVAGERWRLVVRLQATARHRQPARLRRRGLAARERAAGDRATCAAAIATRASTRSPAARRTTCSVPAKPSARASSRRCRTRRYAGVIVALTIGEQRAIPEAQWRVFNRTGIAHLISISGLHVTVFATLAGGLALCARTTQRAR